MSKIAIVFHSGYGHTKRVAESVAAGAKAELIQIDDEGRLSDESWEALNAADAIVFGTPTYMAGPSWQFKRFADASSKIWFSQGWKDKVFAGFTNSSGMSGDKFSTLTYLWALAMQHHGVWVSQGMMPSNAKASPRDSLNFIGGYGGVLTQTPIDASPEEMSKGDLETALMFGKRLAAITERWRHPVPDRSVA